MKPAIKTASAQKSRRQVYIPGSFQRRFVLQFCGIVFLGCLLFGVILYLYAGQALTTAFVNSKLRVMSTADFLLPALGFTTIIVAALVAVMSGSRLLIFSHRIAGPLYRMQKVTELLGEGDLSFRVHFREGDQLQGLAEAMDEAVGDLREQFQEIKASSQEIKSVIQQIKQNGSPSPSEALFEDLEKSQARLEKVISRFRV